MTQCISPNRFLRNNVILFAKRWKYYFSLTNNMGTVGKKALVNLYQKIKSNANLSKVV